MRYIHYFEAPHFHELFRSRTYETHRDAVSALADIRDGLQNVVIDMEHARDVITREAQPVDEQELDELLLDLEDDLSYVWTMDDVGTYTIGSHEIDEFQNEYEDEPGFFSSLIRGDITSAGRSL